MRTWTVATLAGALLVLAGCGSDGSDDAAETSPDPTATATPLAPSTAAPTSPATPDPTESSPTATPPATSPTSTPAPTGTLISYETDDDSGATIVKASDTSKLTGSPADFKTFIAAELRRNAQPEPGCTQPAQIYVSLVDTGGWARGGYFVPQCGGYATLWARSNGAWQEVWSGQSLVECSTLTRYKIPARLAGNQCLRGEDAVPYPG